MRPGPKNFPSNFAAAHAPLRAEINRGLLHAD